MDHYVKTIALKIFVTLITGFAAYYAYFLGAIFDDLFFPAPGEFCATGDVWALEAGAIIFAPLALIGSLGLWFIGRHREIVGVGFGRTGKVSLILLAICAAVNLVFFLPNLFR